MPQVPWRSLFPCFTALRAFSHWTRLICPVHTNACVPLSSIRIVLVSVLGYVCRYIGDSGHLLGLWAAMKQKRTRELTFARCLVERKKKSQDQRESSLLISQLRGWDWMQCGDFNSNLLLFLGTIGFYIWLSPCPEYHAVSFSRPLIPANSGTIKIIQTLQSSVLWNNPGSLLWKRPNAHHELRWGMLNTLIRCVRAGENSILCSTGLLFLTVSLTVRELPPNKWVNYDFMML